MAALPLKVRTSSTRGASCTAAWVTQRGCSSKRPWPALRYTCEVQRRGSAPAPAPALLLPCSCLARILLLQLCLAHSLLLQLCLAPAHSSIRCRCWLSMCWSLEGRVWGRRLRFRHGRHERRHHGVATGCKGARTNCTLPMADGRRNKETNFSLCVPRTLFYCGQPFLAHHQGPTCSSPTTSTTGRGR